jgi:chemotaxis protein MotB
MKTAAIFASAFGGLLVSACVSTGTHQATVDELAAARKANAETTAAFDAFKKKSADDIATLQRTIEAANKNIEEGRRERDLLTSQIEESQKALSDANTRLVALEKDKEQLTATLTGASGKARDLETKLASEEQEKALLEKERAAKEAEIQRLTKTHEDLQSSLQAEIEKGNIRIKQVRDRLTINMVDRVLFDSGKAQVKPAGLKVLKQVSDIVKNVPDKQIRIEGHTDNVPIGSGLKDRFPTNWELSTARATSVVRYLIEQGGVDRANLSAIGYADTRPISGNDTEAGRTSNRRIEIVLYPKDLMEIASEVKN